MSFGTLLSATDIRRRPIGGAARKPVFGCFAVVIDRAGLPSECGSIIETVDVDHCAGTGCGLTDGADIDTTAPANQELGCARTETIRFDTRPVLGPDLD